MILIAKSVSKWYPEIFLILLILMYWVFSATLINPFAIASIALLIAQLNYRKRILGLLLGSSVLIVTIYSSFALVSNFIVNSQLYTQEIKLFVLGTLFLLALGYFSFVLLFKNLNTSSDHIPVGND